VSIIQIELNTLKIGDIVYGFQFSLGLETLIKKIKISKIQATYSEGKETEYIIWGKIIYNELVSNFEQILTCPLYNNELDAKDALKYNKKSIELLNKYAD
jgi:hypothetical protein